MGLQLPFGQDMEHRIAPHHQRIEDETAMTAPGNRLDTEQRGWTGPLGESDQLVDGGSEGMESAKPRKSASSPAVFGEAGRGRRRPPRSGQCR
jgi:hypothetical protein